MLVLLVGVVVRYIAVTTLVVDVVIIPGLPGCPLLCGELAGDHLTLGAGLGGLQLLNLGGAGLLIDLGGDSAVQGHQRVPLLLGDDVCLIAAARELSIGLLVSQDFTQVHPGDVGQVHMVAHADHHVILVLRLVSLALLLSQAAGDLEGDV